MTEEPFVDLVAAYAKSYVSDAGVKERYCKASVSDFSEDVAGQIERAAVAVLERRENVFVTGPQGRGKSYLAAALVREIGTLIASSAKRIERVQVTGDVGNHFLLHGRDKDEWTPSTEWVLVPKALDELRESFSGSDATPQWRGLTGVSIVVLDDLGGHKVTDWTAETLYTLIAERYDHVLPTIVTTNMSKKELAQAIDARLVSRLAEGPQIVLSGEDRRVHHG